MSTAYTDGIMTTTTKKASTTPDAATATTAQRGEVTTTMLSPQTGRVILYGGAALVGGGILYASYRFARKKKPQTRLSDKATGAWKWVKNDYFWFDPSARRFDSVEQFYAEIKHGGDSPQAKNLKMSDLKTTATGVTYKGVRVLAKANKKK